LFAQEEEEEEEDEEEAKGKKMKKKEERRRRRRSGFKSAVIFAGIWSFFLECGALIEENSRGLVFG
jgi:hypothetical protein